MRRGPTHVGRAIDTARADPQLLRPPSPLSAAISSFDGALKALWEWEVVCEEELREWQADERAARNLQVNLDPTD